NAIGEVGARAIAEHLTGLNKLQLSRDQRIGPRALLEVLARLTAPEGHLQWLSVRGCTGVLHDETGNRIAGLSEEVLSITDPRRLRDELDRWVGKRRIKPGRSDDEEVH